MCGCKETMGAQAPVTGKDTGTQSAALSRSRERAHQFWLDVAAGIVTALAVYIVLKVAK